MAAPWGNTQSQKIAWTPAVITWLHSFPPHLQKFAGGLLALLLHLLDQGIQTRDLLRQTGDVFFLHFLNVPLQVPQLSQQMTGMVLQEEAQPFELGENPLPLGFGLLLRGGDTRREEGGGERCSKLPRVPVTAHLERVSVSSIYIYILLCIQQLSPWQGSRLCPLFFFTPLQSREDSSSVWYLERVPSLKGPSPTQHLL